MNLLKRLLGRLSVSRKLMLIYLLDLSAVIFISGILIHEKFIAIDFARKELAGNAYIAEARSVLLMLGRLAPGDTAAPPGTAARAEAIAQAERRWGADMKAREVSAALVTSLHGWAATHGPAAAASADAFDKARALVSRLGNQSNLILDPDLDSYYTMSIVLLRCPELLDILRQMDALARPVRSSGPRPAEDRQAQYLVLEGRLVAVAKGIDSDYGEAFAAAADPRLLRALQPSRVALLASLDRFRAASRSAVLTADVQAPATLPLITAKAELLDELERAWRAAALELDRLIEARIDGFFGRMWLHLGTAFFLLLVILSAVFFVAAQIARPLMRLGQVADRVRESGNYRLRAQWDSGDEIGRLVIAFNGMLEQIDHHRETQQELAATARAAQAQQQLLESTPIPMVVTAVPGHEVLHANAQAHAWLGGREVDPWAVGLEPQVRARFFQQLADREKVDEFEVHWSAGAKPAWAVLSARRIVYQGQDAVLTAFTPINHLKVMERRLELWSKVFEASSEGIMIVDGERRILTINQALSRHTGHDIAEMLGRDPAMLLTESGGERFIDEIWPTVARRGSWQGEVELRRRDETSYPAWMVVNAVRDGVSGVTQYICTTLDITERKASEERIQFLAHHDVLTGLPNRQLFTERLRLAIQHARRSGNHVAVLFIDLDRFKTINDSLGHHVGDELLRSVARRLLEAVRGGDTVSRLGGDEFVIALTSVSGPAEVASLVEGRLIPLIRQSHRADGAELHVSCSVGISMYPDDANDIEQIMRHADVAMYQAKALGRDAAQFFTPELNTRAHARLRTESNLRRAIERNELTLHYQPRVSTKTGRPMGVEALLRWQSEELGPVPPAAFIPIAEETRLILPVGAWVIHEACRQHAAWRDQGHGVVPVSINVSAVQLRDPAFVDMLSAAIALHGVQAGAIELELTESTLMESVTETLGRLHALKRLGVKLSVDDFGTGYSSLHYLNRLPIDCLKIDRSFVSHLMGDPRNLAITRAIIGLGHTLGLQVVAEGVETHAVAQTLRDAHCDELQGYLFARPMSAGDMAEWLVRARVAGTQVQAERSRI